MNSHKEKVKVPLLLLKQYHLKKVWEKKKVPKISLLFRPGEFEKFYDFFSKK